MYSFVLKKAHEPLNVAMSNLPWF